MNTAMNGYLDWANRSHVNVGEYNEVAIANYISFISTQRNRYGRVYAGRTLATYISHIRAFYRRAGVAVGEAAASPVLQMVRRSVLRNTAPSERHRPASASTLIKELGYWHERLRLPPRSSWAVWKNARQISMEELKRLRDACWVLVGFMFGIRQHSVAAFRVADVSDLYETKTHWRISHEKGAERRRGIRENPVWYDTTSSYALDVLRAFRMLRADIHMHDEASSSFWALPGSHEPSGRDVAAGYGRLLQRWNMSRQVMETFHGVRAYFESYGAALGVDTNTRSWVAGWVDGSGAQRQRYYNHVRIEDDSPYFLIGYLISDEARLRWAAEVPPHVRWYNLTTST